jgi:hypothetical protein
LPSSIPAVKKALRSLLRTSLDAAAMTGVEVFARGIAADSLRLATEAILLTDVATAGQSQVATGLRQETPALTGYITSIKVGNTEQVGDDARDRAYAILAVVEQAITANPTINGTLDGAGAAEVSDSGLEDVPVDLNGQAAQASRVRFVVSWGADLD